MAQYHSAEKVNGDSELVIESTDVMAGTELKVAFYIISL